MEAIERINMLKEQVRRIPELCIERAVLLTESYKETESEPPALRRAKALEKILTEMSIHIYDGELIVGSPTSKRVGAPLLPEIEWRWYLEEMDEISTRDVERIAPLTEAERVKANEILPWWNGKSLYDRWHAVVPDEYKRLLSLAWAPGGATPVHGHHMAHCCPGFEKVLVEGLNGLMAKVNEQIAELDLTRVEDFQSFIMLKAMRITLEAVSAFARRYAELAKSLAFKETDKQRKSELDTIAEICQRVPVNPAQSFHEALQSLWFIYLAVMLEGWGPGIGFGRMDQYLYPFYRKDIDDGKITKDKARELISLFFIKVNELLMPFPFRTRGNEGGSGQITLSGITLGGVSPGSNVNLAEELTHLFLEAEEDVILLEDITFRVHSNVSDSLLLKACNLAKLVRGKIKFVSDETVVQQQLNDGKQIDMARDYAVTGCFIHTVPGRSHDPGGDFFNPSLMLELALNNGVCRLTGQQIGPLTGDPRKFKSYKELWQAYTAQVEALLPYCITGINLYMQLAGELLPSPLISTLFDGCIEKGKDVANCGTSPYATLGLWVCGIPSVGDSLAALKKTVFDDQKLTMERVINALDKNFEGEEEIWRMLKSAPKFGNDNDYVDSVVNEVLNHLSNELAKYRGPGGRKYTLAAGAVLSNIIFGKAVGAMPDGRKAGEPLSEGGISPYQGRNISGATSTMKSVAKLNLVRSSGGAVLNLKFNPDSLEGKSKLWKFASLLRTFCEIGGDLVQFNIVSNEMLKDAQKNPEKYRDLLVRVATYSAYFVELPLEVQNEIISRTEMEGF